MGGDIGPDTVVSAAIIALRQHANLRIILVGIEDQLRLKVAEFGGELGDRLQIHHASEVVAMDDSPSLALRKKKNSSMHVAIGLVKSNDADACVSAGNTGALMAISRFVLRMLPGINRPAIIKHLPSVNGHTYMLDLGANVDSTAEDLLDFAVMGVELASAVDNIKNPKVALLNVGEEEIKGNEQVKKAAALLAKTDLNYVGYAEGDDVFIGNINVIVCDGFVGNIALKSSEGAAKLVSHMMKESFKSSFYALFSAFIAKPVLKSLRVAMDPGHYNGASLLGLRGIVVKSHGAADSLAFVNAINMAVLEVENQVPQAISSKLEAILNQIKN